MLDLMPALLSWYPVASGQRCAVVTVVAASGSVPRPIGTSMLVSELGDTLGSLSGGCVEGAVVGMALETIEDGATRQERFGYTAADSFAVGLTCGGVLDVHIAPLHLPADRSLLGGTATAERGMALIRRLDGRGRRVVPVGNPLVFEPRESPNLLDLLDGRPELVLAATTQLVPLLRAGGTEILRLANQDACHGVGGESPDQEKPEPVTLLVQSQLPKPRMLIFGANDFGAALLPLGMHLGYHVTLCDARPAFLAQDRFAAADQQRGDWPHRYLAAEATAGRLDTRTVVCVLSHDPKFDIPLLNLALRLDLAYVGAIGSRQSQFQRAAHLADAGTSTAEVARLHSPIGLDLGAVTPAEVAISIAAEIVATRLAGKPARGRLKDGYGPIHHQEFLWT